MAVWREARKRMGMWVLELGGYGLAGTGLCAAESFDVFVLCNPCNCINCQERIFYRRVLALGEL